jgi:hypothetical protein
MSLRAWSGLTCETEFEEVDVLLDGKNAVIYGGGGSIGSAVARGFAHEGARVCERGGARRLIPNIELDAR